MLKVIRNKRTKERNVEEVLGTDCQHKSQKGVTLVALVVTIIVLLILAGITITAITGDNGIIKQASSAAEATNYSQAREKVEMQVLKSIDKSGEIDTDKLTDNFIANVPGSQIRDDAGNVSEISDDNRITDLPVNVVVDGYDFTIWGSGTVTGEGEEKPSQDKFNITSLNLSSTENSITAKVQASNGNGATYTYYYKLSSSNDWIEIHKGAETTCTIEGLEPNTSYDIKAEGTNGEESSSKEGTISTQDISITIPDANADGVINVNGPNWHGDGTADITITKGDDVDDDLDIEYKKEGDDEYTKLEDGGTIDGLQNGDKIYIHLTDGDRDGEDIEIEIKDETPPTVTVNADATSTNGITVNVNVHDGEGGMPDTPTYNYYIKKTDDPEYPSTPTATDTNASHTFDNLEQGVSYDIKVEVADKAGNTGTGTLPGVTTDKIPDPGDGQTGSIVWGNIKWDPSTGTASVTVSKGTGVSESLELQYQIVVDGGVLTNEAYQSIDNGGIISGIANGSTVYARLWDGNNGGSPASIKIEDANKPIVTVTKGTIGENSIEVTVNAVDNETGMPSPATYKYYIKKSTDGSYPNSPTKIDTTSSYTFSGLDANTSYDIKVEVSDNASNPGSGELRNVTTLKAIPDASIDGVINVNGPNWHGDGTADITITKGDDVDDDLDIEYKKEGDDEYTKLEDGGTIDGLQNGDKIYIHLTDGDRDGEDIKIEIKDETPPTADIKLSATSVNTDGSITATITQTDNESGIDIEKTKYVYNTISSEIGTNEQNYIDGTFSKNPQDIILNATEEGTYYLHVLTVDKAGHKKEIISEAVTVEAAGGNLPGDIDGLTPVEGDEDTGIVAKDEAGNEWVWVEVPKSIYTTAKSDTDYNNIYNDMKKYTSDYSENGYTDSYISGSGNFRNTTEYNNEKNRMLKSVYDNGGFWISRYEIGTTNASQSVAKNTTNVTTPVSQQNAYPIVNKTQPQSQQIVRKMNSQANLLFGVQWDLTLKFLEVKGGLSVSDITEDSTSWGNCYLSYFKIDRGKYNTDWSTSNLWRNATNVSKREGNLWKLTTGAADRNSKMSIYDLAGNVDEWTLESDSWSVVICRGGLGMYGNGDGEAVGREDGYTDEYGDNIGIRAALYGEGGSQSGGGNQGGSGTDEPQTGVIEFGDLQWDSSNTTASVTVSKTEDNTLDLQYKINEGEWTTIQSGETIQNLKDGDLVTACLFDGSNRGYYATLNVVAPKVEIEAGDIASKPNDYYGEYVNYQPSNGDPDVKWRIFYAGTNPNDSSDTTNRIYLIADDYIDVDYAPDSKKGTEMNKSYPYQVWFTDIINNGDYSGSSDITNSLVKPWLNFLNSSYGRYNTNENMQVVAYMLDTNVWSIFKDNEGKAEYAIGGPTLDMFCASYNQKYTNKQIQYKSNNNGYSIKWSTDYDYSSDFGLYGLQKNDSLYVINSDDRAYHTWLASPASSNYTDYLIVITYDGRLYGDYYCGYAGGNMPNGFRPIICLKSDVKLIKQSDGTYNIE